MAMSIMATSSSGSSPTSLSGSPSHRVGPDATAPANYCPHFHYVVELIGRRWTGSILGLLSNGPQRFGELRAAIPGLSDRMLSERLGELTDEGLVARCEEAAVAKYALTAHGEGLKPVFEAIGRFAYAHCVAERTEPKASAVGAPARWTQAQ
jgi:DNA-binding HxlR family transcriptional regulator